jgi:hypothetical protein
MSEAIVDLTEILDRQKITGFNARLLLLTFLVTTTYGLEFGPIILAGSTSAGGGTRAEQGTPLNWYFHLRLAASLR